jgi:hypothetical protein
MGKRLTVEEARGRVIDTINLLKDAESADIDKHMCKYSVYRAMMESNPEEYENEHSMISRALFGHPVEVIRVEPQEEDEPQPVILPPLGPSAPSVIPPEELGPDPRPRDTSHSFKREESVGLCGFLACLGAAWETMVNSYFLVSSFVEVALEELAPLLGVMWIMAGRMAGWIARGARFTAWGAVAVARGARRGATGATKRAMELSKVALIHLVGLWACMALLGAQMAVSMAGIIMDGWTMRNDIIREAQMAA